MKKLFTSSIIVGLFAIVGSANAFGPKETAQYFNGPTVSLITATTATVSLSDQVLTGINEEEKTGVYFEYYETNKVCIAIYPTPIECLPKKTTPGITNVVLTALKPSTSYTVVYKRDNTIRCITTPCPGNEFESLQVQFTTLPSSTPDTPGTANEQSTITTNLGLGSRGKQVVLLQTILKQKGYMRAGVTGYYGILTMQAVRQFQRAQGIQATGFVGVLTRKALNTGGVATGAQEERFEGTITAYSTGCFADGECSITVSGKKVVTTIGRSQVVVGSVIGIPDFGSVESKVGSHAKVYAKKTVDGYTLYGSASYSIEIQ